MALFTATPPSSFRISSSARRQLTITTGSLSLSMLYSSLTTAASGRHRALDTRTQQAPVNVFCGSSELS